MIHSVLGNCMVSVGGEAQSADQLLVELLGGVPDAKQPSIHNLMRGLRYVIQLSKDGKSSFGDFLFGVRRHVFGHFDDSEWEELVPNHLRKAVE